MLTLIETPTNKIIREQSEKTKRRIKGIIIHTIQGDGSGEVCGGGIVSSSSSCPFQSCPQETPSSLKCLVDKETVRKPFVPQLFFKQTNSGPSHNPERERNRGKRKLQTLNYQKEKKRGSFKSIIVCVFESEEDIKRRKRKETEENLIAVIMFFVFLQNHLEREREYLYLAAISAFFSSLPHFAPFTFITDSKISPFTSLSPYLSL